MKNLKKLLPIFAFILGLGLVFTQSAFKSTTATEYGYDPMNTTGLAVNGWVDLSLLIEDDGNQTPGRYACEDSESTCKAVFESQPDAETPIPGDAEPGTFVIY
ncbi:DUF6520 family protein [Pedobacter sp. Du54]|uniref:DUF6520 family protein n=1 Tax=Pedobacter anseongensis TaxID=3133439 RepID=UPI0030AFDC5A